MVYCQLDSRILIRRWWKIRRTAAVEIVWMLAVAAESDPVWPDRLDWILAVAYLLLIIGVPVIGYTSIGLHIRAYLRSLRRALVVMSHYRFELPDWVRRDRPRCIQALGLTLPCTTDDVLAAYRRKVKLLHPDRGGDPKDFLLLQEHFQQAMSLADRE
jgi:hypothetical protein